MFLTALDLPEPGQQGPALAELHDAHLRKQVAIEARLPHVQVGPARWEPDWGPPPSRITPWRAKGLNSGSAHAAATLALTLEMACSSDRAVAEVKHDELVRRVGKPGAAALEKAVGSGLRPADAIAPFMAGRASLEAQRTGRAQASVASPDYLMKGAKASKKRRGQRSNR